MSPQNDDLIAYLRNITGAQQDNEQFWLGVAGPPGSGKSTLCRELLAALGESSVVIPMDGYHYYRSELDQMPDSEEAHRRRGAPFTFNAEKFVADLSDARKRKSGTFPSFDHEVGDPVENDIELVAGRHGLVIVEGNYLLLDEEPWIRLRTILDETWYLQVDLAVCKERVRQRFLDLGLDEEAARSRVDYNDGPNAELVARSGPANADRVIAL